MKDIPGYEGYYAITEDGQIWSYYKRNFLALILDTKGYYVVNLLKEGERKRWRVHRLVALTYIPNPDNYPIVDHIDRNRKNNSVNNLRWTTIVINNNNKDKEAIRQSAYKNLILNQEVRQRALQRASEVNSRAVEMRDKDNHNILYKTYPSSFQAAIQEFGDKQKNTRINRCAHGKCKSAYGYWWCFVEKEE